MIKRYYLKLIKNFEDYLLLQCKNCDFCRKSKKNKKHISHFEHYIKIKQLKREHTLVQKHPRTMWRFIFLIVSGIITIGLLWIFDVVEFNNSWHFIKIILVDDSSLIRLSTLLATAPVVLFVWAFRDSTRLLEVANKRKDTNLKEFQQLQEWATGNTDGNEALQISALHSLRGYLKGQYGEDFRRGAFEIFVSALEDVHTEVLKAVEENKTSIREEIEKNKLCKQINRIAEEEWFNLLIAHDFPTATISLVGVNLSGKYLQHMEYGKSLDLSGANLQGAFLSKAQLQDANLRDSNLQGAFLSKAQLQDANLIDSNLQGAFLSKAQLQDANLRDSNLQDADLSEANLQGAFLWGGELQNINLSEAHLQGADLSGSQLQEANLCKAQLQGTILLGVHLQGANLSQSKLQGANLSQSQLLNANLSKANLQGVTMSRTWLQGANLQKTQLQGANLVNAQLQGANLAEAQLQGVYCGDGLEFLRGLLQQIGKETAITDLKKAYTPLTLDYKKQLISELEELGVCSNKVRERIMNAPDELDLSEAITGKYTKEQAEEWIKASGLEE